MTTETIHIFTKPAAPLLTSVVPSGNVVLVLVVVVSGTLTVVGTGTLVVVGTGNSVVGTGTSVLVGTGNSVLVGTGNSGVVSTEPAVEMLLLSGRITVPAVVTAISGVAAASSKFNSIEFNQLFISTQFNFIHQTRSTQSTSFQLNSTLFN